MLRSLFRRLGRLWQGERRRRPRTIETVLVERRQQTVARELGRLTGTPVEQIRREAAQVAQRLGR